MARPRTGEMAPPAPAAFVPVAVATRTYSIGRTKLFELMRDGVVQWGRVGRNRVVSVRSVERYLGRPAGG